MTDMYDEKKVPEFSLPPYPHEDHSEVSNLFLERDFKQFCARDVFVGRMDVGRREVSPAAMQTGWRWRGLTAFTYARDYFGNILLL